MRLIRTHHLRTDSPVGCGELTAIERRVLRQEAMAWYAEDGRLPYVTWSDDILLKRLLREPRKGTVLSI